MENKENVTLMDEKQKKALLKAQRRAEFEAKFSKVEKTEDSTKTKAQLKAERRAKQEAQRAVKATQSTQNKSPNSEPSNVSKNVTAKVEQGSTAQAIPRVEVKLTEQNNAIKNDSKKSESKTVLEKQDSIIANKELPDKIFSHLPRSASDLSQLRAENIPPSIIEVGYRINKGFINEPTAKCVAMLTAFKLIISQHQASPNKDLKRELQKILFTDCLQFLSKCRPLSISMINAVRHLKLVFSRISSDLNDSEVKEQLTEAIKTFIVEEILCSWKAIVDLSVKKINENDTILTLGYSKLMKRVFLSASKIKKFKVVVVDTRPRFEGKKMLKFLVENNIQATYILINSVSYVMKEVTKVMIEAHSLLGNGYVMSHMGTSQIALVAKAYNVPVIVGCETYKFSDRVHTDCFVYNELGNDINSFFDSIDKKTIDIDSTIMPNLNVLDLLYDLTPHEFVSVIITEKSMLPCSSVSAILRVRETK